MIVFNVQFLTVVPLRIEKPKRASVRCAHVRDSTAPPLTYGTGVPSSPRRILVPRRMLTISKSALSFNMMAE